MPRDSGGTYTLPAGSTATTGTTILASELNTPLADIASAITASLPVDGSKGMSGPLKVADGTAANPSIVFASATTTGFYKKSATAVGLSSAGIDVALSVPSGVVLPFAGYTAPNGWLRSDGSAVSRATYPDLYNAITATGNATKDGTTAVLNSVDTDFTSYGFVGAYVEGSGIAVGTTIASLTTSTITLSAIPTGTGAIAIRILPHGQGDGSTTFNVPDGKGRTFAGREDAATLLTSAGGGVDGSKLGAAGGAQSITLTKAQIPTGLFTLTDPGHSHSIQQADIRAVGSSPTDFVGGGLSATGQSATTGITITDHAGGGAHANVQPTLVLNFIIKT